MIYALGIILLIGVPMFGSGALIVVVATICALTVYQGLRTDIVYSSLAALIGIELLYGIPVGTLSLAYLTAVLLLVGLRRFVALPVWAMRRGWHVVDALQAIAIAYMLFWSVQALGILVGHFIYGSGQLSQRLLMMASAADVRWMLAVIVIVLIIRRRIDEPFRHPIHFGT